MVNGRDAPCNADPQEDVHRVTSGHVPHARVGVLVLACGHLARERVCNKITYLDPDSLPLLASVSSPPSHSLSLIPSHQIYRLSIIPRSHEQQYDTVISFILYIYMYQLVVCTGGLSGRGVGHMSRGERQQKQRSLRRTAICGNTLPRRLYQFAVYDLRACPSIL